MAMPYIDISLLGDKALQRKLNRLPQKIQKKVMRQALREGARPILAAAKTNAPVDTGRMKASLKLRSHKARRGNFGVEVRTGTRTELGIPEGATSYYPYSVEFGHGNVPAHPFMRPALDDNREVAEKLLKTKLRRILQTTLLQTLRSRPRHL